jgi:hypothetical protein
MPASGCRVICLAPLALPAIGLVLVWSVAAAGHPHDAPALPVTPLTQIHPRDKTPPALALSEPRIGHLSEANSIDYRSGDFNSWRPASRVSRT